MAELLSISKTLKSTKNGKSRHEVSFNFNFSLKYLSQIFFSTNIFQFKLEIREVLQVELDVKIRCRSFQQ